MSTYRQAIARVRGTHRLLSSDAQINDRVIAAELQSKATLLIKRETDKRRLWNTNSLFTVLNCVEMETVNLADCCDFVSDIKVSRSVKQLPKMAEGNYQYVLKGVFNVEGEKRLTFVTAERYFNIMKITPSTKTTYAWMDENRYLYSNNEFISKLKVIAFFEEINIDPEFLYPECKCDVTNQSLLYCINPLDMDFKCPGYLEEAAVSMTSKQLLESYFRIPQDSSSDSKDQQTQ